MPVSILERIPLLTTQSSTLNDPFVLGPFDQLAGFVPIQVVWLYEACETKEILSTSRLKRALDLLLSYYPQLAGRVHIDAKTGVRKIADFSAGAELVLAACNERLDAFDAPSPGRIMALPGTGNDLLPPFDPNPTKCTTQPILAVQHTKFACGAVALGIRGAHCICDGDGYFQLVRDLAQLYRGLATSDAQMLANPPCIQPYLAELVGAEASDDSLAYNPSLFHTNPTTFDYSPPPYPPVGKFMRFTRQQLVELKARATEPGGSGWVSTFEALAAHLYRRVYRARLKLHAREPTLGPVSPPDFLSPVNTRARLGLSHYFPNALLTSVLTVDATGPEITRIGLLDGPLWKTAKAIHELYRIPAVTSPADITSTLHWTAHQPDMRAIQSTFRFGSGSFMISAWKKLDYLRLEFDEGHFPVLACPPFTTSSTVDGLAYTLPAERGAAGGRFGREYGVGGTFVVDIRGDGRPLGEYI
ncbi:hypothetical protein MKEN_00347500 [Mycena kentingensis (nom. inval.)]|nr:hypothetical protein MKEN_00347500 [Mycena kentingensis (nom. inval.)]